MNYKEKIKKPIQTVSLKGDPISKLLKLSNEKTVTKNSINIPISKKKIEREQYTNLDCLYIEIQEWFNDFLEDSLLTSSKIMHKHHLGQKNIFLDIIHILESNIVPKTKVIRRCILNETTPDEILSD